MKDAMPRIRKIETEDTRGERFARALQQAREAKANEDDTLDAMVRKSIKLYGA
jgi:hypothetical protein